MSDSGGAGRSRAGAGRTTPGDGRRAGGGLRGVVTADALTFRGLVGAIGGPLGVVESVLPSLVFLVVLQVTRSLLPSLLAPLGLAALFVVVRLLRRSAVLPAISGGIAVALSAVLAAFTGDPKNFFGFGFLLNGVYLAVFLISVLVGRPILGVAVSFLMNDQATWRNDPAKRRMFTWVTLLWAGMFALRLAVELPLYFLGGGTTNLGIARIALGVPLYAPVLVLSVLAVQAVYRGRRDPAVS